MQDSTVKMEDFIHEIGLTIEVEPASDNPFIHSDREMIHHRVTLKTSRGEMAVFFSQGLAHTEEPTAADVLDCLASDASMAEEYSNGIDLAVSLGDTIESSEDADRARETFRVIQEQTEGLKRILGDEATEVLLYEVERL